MLVTPLRDGMNLVAKEYVASRIRERGALVLSEFTGAAEQMTHAWLVNPYDILGMKNTIMAALAEPGPTARARMRRLRRGVLAHDVTAWADSFLAALAGTGAPGATGCGAEEDPEAPDGPGSPSEPTVARGRKAQGSRGAARAGDRR